MKAEELRIGNWVNTKEFHAKDVQGFYQVKADWLMYSIMFEPIPLTEEILLKSGFTLMGIIFRINNGLSSQFDINYSPSRGVFYYDSSKYSVYTEVEIKYLHQLQNLYFALTNEELTIKL